MRGYVRNHRTDGLRLRVARQPVDPRPLWAAGLHHAQTKRIFENGLFRYGELPRASSRMHHQDRGRRPADFRHRFADAGGTQEAWPRPDRPTRTQCRRQKDGSGWDGKEAIEALTGTSTKLKATEMDQFDNIEVRRGGPCGRPSLHECGPTGGHKGRPYETLNVIFNTSPILPITNETT